MASFKVGQKVKDPEFLIAFKIIEITDTHVIVKEMVLHAMTVKYTISEANKYLNIFS